MGAQFVHSITQQIGRHLNGFLSEWKFLPQKLVSFIIHISAKFLQAYVCMDFRRFYIKINVCFLPHDFYAIYLWVLSDNHVHPSKCQR